MMSGIVQRFTIAAIAASPEPQTKQTSPIALSHWSWCVVRKSTSDFAALPRSNSIWDQVKAPLQQKGSFGS